MRTRFCSLMHVVVVVALWVVPIARAFVITTTTTTTTTTRTTTTCPTCNCRLPFWKRQNSFSLVKTVTSRLPRPDVPKLSAASQNDQEGNSDDANLPTTTTAADAIICGGGPAGLLTAIMLAQKFPTHKKIKVYERRPAPPPSPTDESIWGGDNFAKFYLVGLGGRGQLALEKFGVWKDVRDVCTVVNGRKDWAPGQQQGVERIFEGRKFDTQVLPRDKLVSVLYKHIVDNYSTRIELNYGFEVKPLDFEDMDGSKDGASSVLVQVSKCQQQGDNAEESVSEDISCDSESMTRVTTALLIAADGTARTVANEMERDDQETRTKMNPFQRLWKGKPFHVTRYEDDNQRVYKTIPIKMPTDWRPDLNYSARSGGGRVNFDALPANDKGQYCAVLLLRKEDEMAQANVDPVLFRNFLDKWLPQFTGIISDDVVDKVAQKPPSFLPGFRFVGPRLCHPGGKALILGDAAHTVKPYFGLGANSALEDVKVLSEAIESTTTLQAAVDKYSKQRAKEAETLVRISRDLDRPGAIGAFTFLIPLIMDSIFHNLAPKLFAPNIISMLQRDDLTFVQVATRKRLDRLLQVTLITGGLAATISCARLAVTALARALGRRASTTTAVVAATGLAFAVLSKFVKFLVPGMAPADVLGKLKTNISSKDSFDTEKEDAE